MKITVLLYYSGLFARICDIASCKLLSGDVNTNIVAPVMSAQSTDNADSKWFAAPTPQETALTVNGHQVVESPCGPVLTDR